MDKSDQLTDLEVEIASLLQLHIRKDTLQSEVVAKKEELERVQGLKRKQQEKHIPSKKKQKTGQITNTHCASISNNIFHDTDRASTSISTRDNIFVDETCVNAQKENLVMAKSAPPPATRNLMGEFDRVKIAKKNVKQKETLYNEGEQHEDEREQLHNTNCTIVSHNINHDINITASSTSNIHNIQLDETPVDIETEDSLSSNEEVEAEVQTKKKYKKTIQKEADNRMQNTSNASI